MPITNPDGDYLANHFTVQLYALVERGFEGKDEPTRFELNAGLLLAIRQIERLQGQVQLLRKEDEPDEPAAPVAKAPAQKCRHEFGGVPPDLRCVKCFAVKKANGRPKKAAGVPVPGGIVPAGEVAT